MLLRRVLLFLCCMLLWNFSVVARAGGEQIRVRALAWNGDGDWLAVGRREDRLEVFQPDQTSDAEPLTLVLDSPPTSIAWHPTLHTRLAVLTGSGTLTVVDVLEDRLEIQATLPTPYDEAPIAFEVSWSSDGSWLAALHIFAGLAIWNVETGELHTQYPLNYAFVDNAWSPRDSDLLLLTWWDPDAGSTLMLWDAAQQAPVWELVESGSLPIRLDFNAAGDRFVTAQSGGFYPEAYIRVHDVLDGQVLETFRSQFAEPDVLWSPHSYLVLSTCNIGSDLSMEVWDMAAVNLLLDLNLPDAECAFAINADDALAYSAEDVEIRKLELP